MPTLLQASMSSVPAGAWTALPSTVILTGAASAMVSLNCLLPLTGCQVRRAQLYFFYLLGVALGVGRHQ